LPGSVNYNLSREEKDRPAHKQTRSRERYNELKDHPNRSRSRSRSRERYPPIQSNRPSLPSTGD